MIDAPTLKLLSKVHPRKAKPAVIFDAGRAIVHSPLFVLELKTEEVSVTDVEAWPGKPVEGIRQWRYKYLPQDQAGEPAQARIDVIDAEVEGEEPIGVIRFRSASLKATLAEPWYDFFNQILEKPEYRLYAGKRRDGSPQAIGIFINDKLTGVVGQWVSDVLIDENDWDTV